MRLSSALISLGGILLFIYPFTCITIFDVRKMERGSEIYHNKDSNSRRKQQSQIAPIAAEFEDCQNCFSRLHDALKEHPSLFDLDLAEENLAKFLTWGNDTGAKSQSLDHSLRKSSILQKKTLELLTILHSTLEEGMRLFVFETSSMPKTSKLIFVN